MIDDFLDKFGGSKDPSYSFYGGEVELFYNDARNFYYILKDGEQVIQDGVTNAVHIIDKSEMLIPWAAKMTIEKLLRTVPTRDARINLSFDEFEKVAMEAKSAHRERLEDAANVGHVAHDHIEGFIKAALKGESVPVPTE